MHKQPATGNTLKAGGRSPRFKDWDRQAF